MTPEVWFEQTGQEILSEFFRMIERVYMRGIRSGLRPKVDATELIRIFLEINETKRGESVLAKRNDPNRELRIRVGMLLDRHCKHCPLVKGVNFDKRKPICDACEIGKQLQELGSTLKAESEERKRRSRTVEASEPNHSISEEDSRMASFTLSKEEYLKKRLKQSRNAIAKEAGISMPGLYHWLKKWGIKDPAMEEIALTELMSSLHGNKPDSPDGGERKSPTQQEETKHDSGMKKSESAWVSNRDPAAPPEALPKKYIQVMIPIYDIGLGPNEQRLKCYEEFEEFGAELEAGGIDYHRCSSEMFDLLQAFVHLVRSHMMDLIEGDIDDHLIRFFHRHNQLHMQKIKAYAKDRGWTRVSS
jgi:hypothetical protein